MAHDLCFGFWDRWCHPGQRTAFRLFRFALRIGLRSPQVTRAARGRISELALRRRAQRFQVPALTFPVSGRISPSSYITTWVYSGGNGLPHRNPLGARGPDPARHRRPAGAGRGIGDIALRAFRSEPSGDLEAPQGTGEGRHHLTRTRGAIPALPARGRTAEGDR